MENQPEFLRPMEGFFALGLRKSVGYEALKKGDIPSVRIAGQIRIPRRWIAEQVERALSGDAK